jgi:hypothetical protein
MRSIVEDLGNQIERKVVYAQLFFARKFHANTAVERFLASNPDTGGPPTWSRPIDVNKAKTPGISARIVVIGPSKITSLAHRNPPLVSFATSADLNVPTKTVNNAREAWITT